MTFESGDVFRETTSPEQLVAEFWTPSYEQKIHQTIERNLSEVYADNPRAFKRNYEIAVKAEKVFANKVISSFFRWSSENKAVVLWDIDETIGQYNIFRGDGTNFRIRPCYDDLMKFLHDHFSNIRCGVLTTREKKAGIEDQFSSGHLSSLKKYFDSDLLYSSRLLFEDQFSDEYKKLCTDVQNADGSSVSGVTAKIKILNDLKKSGINAKLIDDLSMFGNYLEQNNLGVCVSDCRATSDFCSPIQSQI